ncbi:MAG: hypothetical protein IJ480_06110 [Clostridia bacterium]|nr:hypothetical protein [Clostridia bacterium]
MKAKKMLAMLLAAILASSALTACGGAETETDAAETTGTAGTETTADAGETTRAQIEDNLPDKDFGGRNFHLLTRQNYDVKFMPEDMTGEAVNDALYARNTKIMEEYNITMSYVAPACEWGSSSKTWNQDLENSVMAGDGAYDLVAGYASTVPEIVTKNILLNWHEVPYIDLSQPWWSERVSEALTVNGKLFLLTGDYSLSLWDDMFGFLFNKQVALDHGIEDLYELTRSGGWTMDKLAEFCSMVSNDSNGDGVWDENDTYGLVSNWSTSIDTFQIGCEMDLVSHTDDGGLEITMMSEKAVDILSRVVSLYNDAHAAYSYSEGGDLTTYNNMFSGGQALFYAIFFANITSLRDMETDFGILPYPKLDETQAQYSSTSRDNFDLFVLPIDVKDQEFSGIITEALCAESYRTVVPTYYDVVLKTKSSRDEESAEMIDIIRDSLTFDLGYLCSTSLNGLGHLFVNLVRANSTDLASKYAGAETAAKTALQEMLAAYGYEG